MGTVGGNGVGVVLLKRLEDALADGDPIRAVIRGAAINNDGSVKVGYTAPSVEGQARVIAMAQAMADVHPDTIGLIEAHGTGTPLGDPIEVAALTQVFRAATDAVGVLRARVAQDQHRPPRLRGRRRRTDQDRPRARASRAAAEPALRSAQPQSSISRTAPSTSTRLRQPWPSDQGIRRAGVSSFGIGGTNAHVVLEEAPPRAALSESRRYAVVPLSARSDAALGAIGGRMSAFFEREPDAPPLRRRVHVRGRAAGLSTSPRCRGGDARGRGAVHWTGASRRAPRHVQPCRAARPCSCSRVRVRNTLAWDAICSCGKQDFATSSSVARTCSSPTWDSTSSDVVYPPSGNAAPAPQRSALDQTAQTQPALFVVEYALARLLQGWGIQPHAMLGHSIGEYVAACLAGVFSLDTALMLVAARGRVMQRALPGAMLAVSLPEADVRGLLGANIDLATVNGPSQCVVSGPTEAIGLLEMQLAGAGVAARALTTSHAFHSSMMAAAAAEFETVVAQVKLNSPSVPFLSNVTGDWITPGQATSPAYWAMHLRQTVRFGDGLGRLIAAPEWTLLEVGPGTALSTLARQHPERRVEQPVTATMRHLRERRDDDAVLLEAVGDLWSGGVDVDWRQFYADEKRGRVHLPTYPFERQRYWIDAPAIAARAATRGLAPGKQADIDKWFYRPVWRESGNVPAATPAVDGQHWLVLSDAALGPDVARRARNAGATATVVAAQGSAGPGAADFQVAPTSADDYARVLDAVAREGRAPDVIVHTWSADPTVRADICFGSLLSLAQALARRPPRPVRLLVVTRGLHPVNGGAVVPDKATVLGPIRVIPQELPHIRCVGIDLPVASADAGVLDVDPVTAVLAEAAGLSPDVLVAYRNGRRWIQTIEPLDVSAVASPATILRQRGTYLVTGGFGGIGLVLAEHLARVAQARLVLVGRTPLPDRSQWDAWRAQHDPTNRVSRAIESIRAIEALGGEVMVASADVADIDQMAALVDRVRERFGALNGVIHAAGIAGGGMIQRKTAEAAARVLAPKVNGTLVLERVLRNDALDFFVLCSSLASVVGGFGQVDYCGANAFLDACAQAVPPRLHAARVVSIDWDTWQETGMAVDTDVPRELAAARDQHLKDGITNEEGTAVFMRALGASAPRLLISTRDWQTRLAALAQPAPAPAAAPPTAPVVKHDRPSLESEYVAPRNDTEAFVAATWEDMLGVAPIGVDDDFFALGGHSLLAIQVAARLRERFEVEVPVQLLFDAPTIAQLAARVQSVVDAGGTAAADRLAEMVQYVGQLSDEEVQRLLAGQGGDRRP